MQPCPIDNHSIVGVLGKTRMGKTSLMREMLKGERRFCIIDATNNPAFDGYFEMANIEEVSKALIRDEFQIVCRFDYDETLALLRMLFHPQICNLTIAFDEISVYSNVDKNCLEIDKLFLQGGRFNKRIIWNTQRAALISRNVTSQTSLVLSFRLDEAADTRYLNSRFRNGRFLEYLPKGTYVPAKGDQDDLDFVSNIYGLDFEKPLSLPYIELKLRKPAWWKHGGQADMIEE